MGYCYEKLGEMSRARTSFSVALHCLDDCDLNVGQLAQWQTNIKSSFMRIEKLADKSSSISDKNDIIPNVQDSPCNEYPAASSTIQVEANAKMGRYFKAKKTIKPAQTLLVEKAHAACLLPEKLPTHCYHCFTR